ncbi:adenosine 3'-phospho 5'-phosphosulfate transporter 2 isoform X2 [Bacillus rossius redtenbacheri]
MGFSNSAVGYLNYPTQVIFKCCKLIPVLVGGVVIQKKRYGALDVLAACSMCAGLALFTLADSQVSPNFDTTGVVMISCALVCDAAIGNVQEKSMKMHNATNTEVVFYSYFIGFLYLIAIMAVSGDFIKGALFCAKHPWETYGYGLLFSMSGYLGIQIVLTLVKTTGALVAATVTTCRKAVTIMISFVFFSKPFTFQYVWSGLLVILGIYINIYSKNQHKIDIRAIFNKVLNRISVFTKQTKYPHYRKILSDV